MTDVFARFGSRLHWQLGPLLGALVALVLGFGGAGLLNGGDARADSNTINFDGYALGTINGQDGWSSTGAAGSGCAVYDHAVVASGGGKALRISNAVTSGCFGDQTFSKSLVDEAGETSAANNGMSGGTRQPHYESQFTLASAVPGSQQPGLSMSVSPDRGDGARMSYLRFEDQADGIHVFFDDYQDAAPFGTFLGDPAGQGPEDDFVESDIATINRAVPHTIKFVMQFVDGARNDVVKIYIDSTLVKTGTSWEDYYRYVEGNPTRTVDSLLFRTGGTAAPGTAGNGFLIDDLSLASTTPPQCTATCYVDAAGGNDANGGTSAIDAKKTIQAAVSQVSAGGAVNVAAGTYNEDVTVTTANIQLLGAGIDVSYVVGAKGGGGSTIQVSAGGVVVDGFTITRDGNNVPDWNNANGVLNTAGVSVQSQGNTVELRNSKLTGNRTGIDINNSNGNSIHNNIIDNNRTGLIFRNTTNSTSVVNNFITNNWTDGVLFLDGGSPLGSNVPAQSAASSTFNNNDISGNWYGQVEDRQSGGSIPIAPANPKNFELNWWGTTAVSVTTAQGGEPGYAAQIPVVFGGSATPPGGQPDIKGSSSANIDYDPMQCSGVDTSPTVGFQPSGVLCAPSLTTLVVSPSNLNGWYFWNDFNDTFTGSPGAFVSGPATAPLGTGSVELGPLTTSSGATGQSVIATDAYFATPLANITALSYSTFQPGPTLAISLQFDVRYRTADSAYGGRLVFEPYQNGAVIVGAGWQSWSPLSGKWWASKTNAAGTGGAQVVALPAGNCAQSSPCTWSQINAAFPAAQVYGRFMLKSGSNWSGFDGNADALKIGIGGTNNKLFDFEPNCSTDCYVRTDGSDTNTGIANTPADAKRTIQAAVNTVSVGGTVHVAAGTYDENVTITKGLTLVGAGQASTFVRPGVSNPDCNAGGGGSLCSGVGPANAIILVQADNVTIHDLTLNGDNPALVSGIVTGGADLNARNGIITNHLAGAYQNLAVHDVTVKNVFLRGMYASSGGTFNFHDDTVDNVQADPASIAMFNFGGSGTFASNTVSNANDAISSNHSSGTQFLNNTITLSASGVHTDNAGDGGGVADLLDGNTVSNCMVNGYGVWTFVPYIQPTVKRNKVTNCSVGMAATGSFVPVGTLFQDNEVDGASAPGSIGVYITTDLFSFGTENVTATLTGNIIKNNAVGIDADAQSPKTTTINASRNSMFGNTAGVALSNNPTPPVLPGPIGAFSLTMTGNWWGSATGPTHVLNPGGSGNSVPNGVTYSPWLGIGTDAAPATTGFQLASPMTWVAGQNVCDVTCIQKAVDFASPGDTINVLAGTFNEQVQISKSNLLINGGGMLTTIVKPSGVVANTNRINTNPAAPIFDIENATGVNIQNLTADGSLNGLTGCAPDFLGFYYKKASGNLTNAAASHIKLSPALLGCQTGVGLFVEADSPDVANVVINNATITDYQKGGVVANRTGTTISISNSTVTGVGPTTQIAANGIQVAFGATGTLTNNNVSGNDYTPNTDAATGILLFQATAANVTGNNIHDNQEGLDIESTNGVIVGNNTFASTRDVAIYANGSSGGSYTGNTAMGQPGSTGMYVFDVSSNNTVTGNAFRNGDFGVVVDFGGGAPAANQFNGNCLAANIGAGVETLGVLVGPKINAKSNWWGAVNGPTPPGSGDSIIPGDGSTIDPSLFLTAPIAGCPTPTTDTDGDGLTDVAEVNTYGTDPLNPDTDGDGCGDGKEVGPSHLAGGERNPKLDGMGQWDFFDVPVPALLPAATSGTRNKLVSLADVLADLTYVGTSAANPNSANAAGAKYGSDLNSNGVVDGREYDRSPSVVPGQPWHSGPPNGVVSLGDVLAVLAQVGTNCN